jgi:hypothetical protein
LLFTLGRIVPRFVILEHDYPILHWDFFLEAGNVLRAWRILALPVPNSDLPADLGADHRLFYLDYEGPVSGGRGTVTRFDYGTFSWEIDTVNRVQVHLEGSRCRGVVELRKDGEKWVFYWREKL